MMGLVILKSNSFHIKRMRQNTRYLAPLNYDRFFKKIFSDTRIAKRFLEDFLDVTIDSLEVLPTRQRFTDESSIVEFDFRCKIDDSYVIIDMQQWYKSDLTQRFYIYHALNTGLQLEHLPKERLLVNKTTMKVQKVTDYEALEPVVTLIWLVDDALYFKHEKYVAYTMAPELVLQFLENERLWHKPEIKELLIERENLLKVINNDSKGLDFLRRNRLIFALQRNIVKSADQERYGKWFRFAEKSRQKENTPTDFEEFEGDDVFEEMIRRLNQHELTDEDLEYIDSEEVMWEEVSRWEEGRYKNGMKNGLEKGFKVGVKKGMQMGEIGIVTRMLNKGMTVDEIADLTGLSLDRVKKIIEDL